MVVQQAIVRGLHAEACDRAKDGKRVFDYQRLLLLVTTKNGKPKHGERFAVVDLAHALGVTTEGIWRCVAKLRDRGACIMVERRTPTAGGEYFWPKTEEEMRAGLETVRVDLRGRVNRQRNIIAGIANDFPALAGQAPMLLTEDTLQQIGGAIALETAKRLAASEEARHALPAASA